MNRLPAIIHENTFDLIKYSNTKTFAIAINTPDAAGSWGEVVATCKQLCKHLIPALVLPLRYEEGNYSNYYRIVGVGQLPNVSIEKRMSKVNYAAKLSLFARDFCGRWEPSMAPTVVVEPVEQSAPVVEVEMVTCPDCYRVVPISEIGHFIPICRECEAVLDEPTPPADESIEFYYEVPNYGEPASRPLKTAKAEWPLFVLTDEQQAFVQEVAGIQNVNAPFKTPQQTVVAVRHYTAKLSTVTGPFMDQQPVAFDHTPTLNELIDALGNEWARRAKELERLATMQKGWRNTKTAIVPPAPLPAMNEVKAPMTIETLISELEDILAVYHNEDDGDEGEVMAIELSLLLGEWHSSHK